MIISLQNISKSFGANNVLKNISIAIDKKECVGIIGPNGAGKSTLFKIISGSLFQDGGSIIFNDANIDKLSIEKRSRLGISQSFQSNSLFNEMTVKENIMVACSQSFKVGWELFKSLDKRTNIITKSYEIAEEVGLTEYLDFRSDNLSYGLQRQLEVGLAIANNPSLLLLDEPTAGMSNEETKNIVKMVKKLSTYYTTIIVEHDMDVIYSLTKKIYVLDSGDLIFDGTPNEVKNSKLVQERYIGIKQ
ncbi:MAG: Lipopolysaccharide export system ATP-binding protein LptB [Alphaproteobacteria bacterium MarineAlpha9_Bin2]|nr:MAG: Lipopolysaccharide export system ATP-binding protein LptB [Alphaproteobacteria bacterium MarineAlpha9_Bin2]